MVSEYACSTLKRKRGGERKKRRKEKEKRKKKKEKRKKTGDNVRLPRFKMSPTMCASAASSNKK